MTATGSDPRAVFGSSGLLPPTGGGKWHRSCSQEARLQETTGHLHGSCRQRVFAVTDAALASNLGSAVGGPNQRGIGLGQADPELNSHQGSVES